MHSRRCSFFFLIPLLLVSLSGCSTTGYSTKAAVVAPRTIKSPSSIPPELIPYVPRFVELLQAKGFAVGRTDDPRALELVFEFNGNPFNLRVSAGLWRDGIPILSSSATNSGWGTALARGSAVNALVDSTASSFEVELSNMALHTQLVPDAQR